MNDTTPTPKPLLARIPIAVRWRDMDSFGHVNNAMYVSYLEEARCRWLIEVTGLDMHGRELPVLVNSNVNYRRPITWPSQVVVELFVEKLGNSSLTIGHRIVSDTDSTVLYSDGSVVVVWIDTATGQSIPLPEAVRIHAGG
ncbi:MAG: thioesterase family protein [Pseudoxanthomonas sp.]